MSRQHNYLYLGTIEFLVAQDFTLEYRENLQSFAPLLIQSNTLAIQYTILLILSTIIDLITVHLFY